MAVIINFTPQRHDEPQQEWIVAGNVITIDGEAFDFGPLAEGDVLPLDAIGDDRFSGPASRENGNVALHMVLRHGPNAPEATRFPQPVTVTRGLVPQPPYDSEAE